MKRILLLLTAIIVVSCGEQTEKERITELLKAKIGNELPFNEVKIGEIENGTAVIVDDSWCYWIDKSNKIYCVNGTGKSVYDVKNSECEYAPIKAMFSDIEKIVK
ncbi:MAG: hypothetical protein COA32_12175 [Fluviicola sp.]|nr:MAG: hypothetical protein COA32_12175 [Fluviicola sp.]